MTPEQIADAILRGVRERQKLADRIAELEAQIARCVCPAGQPETADTLPEPSLEVPSGQGEKPATEASA